jgi:hypothetical protein
VRDAIRVHILNKYGLDGVEIVVEEPKQASF